MEKKGTATDRLNKNWRDRLKIGDRVRARINGKEQSGRIIDFNASSYRTIVTIELDGTTPDGKVIHHRALLRDVARPLSDFRIEAGGVRLTIA